MIRYLAIRFSDPSDKIKFLDAATWIMLFGIVSGFIVLVLLSNLKLMCLFAWTIIFWSWIAGFCAILKRDKLEEQHQCL